MQKMVVGIIDSNSYTRNLYQSYFKKSDLIECPLAVEPVDFFLHFSRDFMQFDAVLLDIDLPNNEGLKAISKIKSVIPKIEVIVFTNAKEESIIIQSLRLGSSGYLLKNLSKTQVENQLLKIKDGGAPMSPLIARKLIEYFAPAKKSILPVEKTTPLSKKERFVTSLLIDGLSYADIAKNMLISIHGVRFHIKNIYKKLCVNSRSEVVKLYLDKAIEL